MRNHLESEKERGDDSSSGTYFKIFKIGMNEEAKQENILYFLFYYTTVNERMFFLFETELKMRNISIL